MKKSVRVTALFVAVLMLSSMVAYGVAEEAKWDYELDTSPYEFTVWWPSVWGWAKPSVENGWDMNSPVIKHITEKTGVTMNIDMPVGQELDLAGPIIASGEYPDAMIFNNYESVYVNQMIEAGQVYAISDLADEYAPRFGETTTSTLRQLHDGKDGKLWKYVGFEQDEAGAQALVDCGIAPTAGSNTEFVRADILKAYGKDDIKTLDELTDLLRFIRDNYPDVDPLCIGEDPNAELPMAGDFFKHFCSLFGMHLSLTYPEGDDIKLIMRDPKYVEMMKWLNQLYREGIITDSTLTDDMQAKDEKLFAGRYGVIVDAVFNIYNTVNTTLETNNGGPEKNYKAIGPSLREGGAFETSMYRSKGSFQFVITKNAKQPERIIRFLEYLLTDEGQTTMLLGVEGDSWQEVDGKKTLLPEAADLIAKDLQAYCLKYNVLGRWAPFAKVKYWSLYCDDFLTPEGAAREENNLRLNDYVADIWADGFVMLRNSLPKGSDEDVINGKITTAYKIAAAKIISAPDDATFQKDYDDFIAEIDSMGAAQVEAALTAQYQKDKERMK